MGSSLECRFMNRAPTTWLQRVPTKFGEFVKEQRDTHAITTYPMPKYSLEANNNTETCG